MEAVNIHTAVFEALKYMFCFPHTNNAAYFIISLFSANTKIVSQERACELNGQKLQVHIQNDIYLGACPHSGPPSGFILPAPLLGILLCGIPGGHCMLPRPMVGAGISFQWDTLPA